MSDSSGGDRPELADAGRLARKLVSRAVRLARTEDQPLVDLAAELPLPDAAARRALIRLYQGSLVLDDTGVDAVVARTNGVTAAFLKELLRKAALLAGRSQLTRVLLGGQAAATATAG